VDTEGFGHRFDRHSEFAVSGFDDGVGEPVAVVDHEVDREVALGVVGVGGSGGGRCDDEGIAVDPGVEPTPGAAGSRNRNRAVDLLCEIVVHTEAVGVGSRREIEIGHEAVVFPRGPCATGDLFVERADDRQRVDLGDGVDRGNRVQEVRNAEFDPRGVAFVGVGPHRLGVGVVGRAEFQPVVARGVGFELDDRPGADRGAALGGRFEQRPRVVGGRGGRSGGEVDALADSDEPWRTWRVHTCHAVANRLDCCRWNKRVR